MATSTYIGSTIAGTGTSLVSTAFVPTAGSQLVVFVRGGATRATGTLASSVGGKTFSQKTFTDFLSTSRMYMFVADQGSDASSQTVTFDCTGDTASDLQIFVFENDSPNFGLTGILQTKTATGLISTPCDATFDSAVDTNNITYLFAAQGASGNLTPPAGWTEVYDAGNPNRSELAHRNSGFSGSQILYTNNAVSSWGLLVAEVNCAAGGNQSVAANVTSETDSAIAIGHAKERTIGVASETEAALPIIVVGQAIPAPAPPPSSGGGGGYAEAEFEGYKAKRRARMREVAERERERERLKEKIAAENKRVASKRQQRQLSERLQRERAEKLAKYDRQIAAADAAIAAALAELARVEAAMDARDAMIAERRRRLLLVALAAA